MSIYDENDHGEEDGGRTIGIHSDDNADEFDDGPKLAASPEMEAALKEALESMEDREKQGSAKSRLGGAELKDDERQHYQNRIKDLHIQLAEKAKEMEALEERLARRQADFENYKKRLQREQADRFNYGNEKIAREFLRVMDNLERALQHAKDGDPQTITEGVELTLKDMLQIFSRFDVIPIKAVGEKFDPNYHEAVAQIYVPDMEPGMVVEEHQKGYMLKDRLLRPSMVVVSGKPPVEG